MSLKPQFSYYSSPLVWNEGDEIQSSDRLTLLLESIFSDACFSELKEALLSFFEDISTQNTSHTEIINILEEYLDYHLQLSHHKDEVIFSALHRLGEHKSLAPSNRLAYSPSNKANPNSVFWPDPNYTRAPRSIYDELPYAQCYQIIDKTTPIGSGGSCFAIEIAKWLRDRDYNYIQTEPAVNASANWGILFNAPSFRQLVEKLFSIKKLPKILWSGKSKDGTTIYYDPFREDVLFDSIEEYEADYEQHLEAGRQALLECEYFIITLGMNEVWSLKADNSIISRSPWRLASSLVRKQVLSVEDNVRELQTMLDLWRYHNPKIKLIISVSPVPFHATFRGSEYHVIAANCHSKSVLRVAAEEFVRRNEGAFYFPSYEMVSYCTENPWDKDQRHVSREAVENVMKLFQKSFVREEEISSNLESRYNYATNGDFWRDRHSSSTPQVQLSFRQKLRGKIASFWK